MKGRDMNTVRIERSVVEEILRNVSHPDLLRAIFEKARDLAIGRITQAEFDFYCRSQPCILWAPENPTQRHVPVRVTRSQDLALPHVARVVYTITHVKEPALLSHEEVMHPTCGLRGADNTAIGCCLNPTCMSRGTIKTRQALKVARRNLRTVGIVGKVAV